MRIAEGDVRWLRQTWSSQWLREPSAEELKGLVDDLLNEKLMAREAEAVGLGEDDTIIRRRLAQKLKFLVEDTVQLAEPSETELRHFYAANLTHTQAAPDSKSPFALLRAGLSSLSPCGRGCPSEARAGEGSEDLHRTLTPHPARARYRSALATLSHKGRGEKNLPRNPALLL